MNIEYRAAKPTDLERCTNIRGMTGDNPLSREVLESIGVTTASSTALMENGTMVGVVCEVSEQVVGFCFGDTVSGEIMVLALLPEYENHGVGKEMLNRVMHSLFALGLEKLWLYASSNPQIRAHGFYRRVGWRPSGKYDTNGDEMLEYCKE